MINAAVVWLIALVMLILTSSGEIDLSTNSTNISDI
jgi:hypothetical protein